MSKIWSDTIRVVMSAEIKVSQRQNEVWEILSYVTPSMSEVISEIRDAFPPDTVDETIIQYLGGLWDDPDEEPEDVLRVTREMLRSAVRGHNSVVDKLISWLTEESRKREEVRSKQQRPALMRLDNVIDMSKAGAMSKTIGFAEGVDLSSINKSK